MGWIRKRDDKGTYEASYRDPAGRVRSKSFKTKGAGLEEKILEQVRSATKLIDRDLILQRIGRTGNLQGIKLVGRPPGVIGSSVHHSNASPMAVNEVHVTMNTRTSVLSRPSAAARRKAEVAFAFALAAAAVLGGAALAAGGVEGVDGGGGGAGVANRVPGGRRSPVAGATLQVRYDPADPRRAYACIEPCQWMQLPSAW